MLMKSDPQRGIVIAILLKTIFMDSVNSSNDRLSFPQRYWLLLCIVVAIVSPILVNSLQVLAHRTSYNQAMNQKPVQGGNGGLSPSGGAVAPGDTSRPGSVNAMGASANRETKNTSYKVAAPPQK
jgi:hypothetical protein